MKLEDKRKSVQKVVPTKTKSCDFWCTITKKVDEGNLKTKFSMFGFMLNVFVSCILNIYS